jgi:transglutaminase-like putative cysteine protease
VQAICDFVQQRISFGYEHASHTRTAMQSYKERRGVCRDHARLAIALRRAMNIPARYCIDAADPYFELLTIQWLEGSQNVFRELPPLAG